MFPIMRSTCYVVFLWLFFCCFWAVNWQPLNAKNPDEPVHYAAPPLLPNVLPQMNTAGFWISRHPYPDSLILTREQIKRFNANINKQGTVTRIWQHSSRMNGSSVKEQIRKLLSTLFAMGKYDSTGNETSDSLKSAIRANAAMDKVPGSIQVRFAFPLSVARQRFAPSFANLNNVKLDIEFDEAQNSGENIGSPVVLYHDSADGLWAYGACATSSGWFLKSELHIVSQKDWLAYQNATDKVVCLSPRVDIWQNEKATQYQTFCRMGTAFPLLGEVGAYYKILIPYADSLGAAYISKEDATTGFLHYTPRNIYKQAFKMLNMPYGWGDTDGDFDCSSLLKHIFATFGIYMPRNGLQQAKAGKKLHEFSSQESDDRRDDLIEKTAIGAISLLRLNGHIMLYLGSYNGKAYALHDIWGYRKPSTNGKDDTYGIKKTVVSDLYLSQNTQRGSLLKRLTMISAIR